MHPDRLTYGGEEGEYHSPLLTAPAGLQCRRVPCLVPPLYRPNAAT
ncbi:hypothetical protein ABIE67_000563 [Streptomyces sp. V4I8]